MKGTLSFTVIFSLIFKSWCMQDIGPGEWELFDISECQGSESDEIQFEVSSAKMNRTHERFNAKLKLNIDLNDNLSVEINMCKKMDGGCKPFQKLADDSVVAVLNKHAKSNTESALRCAGFDPPELPMPAGEHEIKDFLFDICEMPSECVYGDYIIEMLLLRDGGVRVACALVAAAFRDTFKNCGDQDSDER